VRRPLNPPPSKGGARGGISNRCHQAARGVLAPLIAALLLIPAVRAEQAPPVKSPVSPQESLQHFALSSNLKIELAAHEPQVIDPVAIRFDGDGRMWVVEMRDYPTGAAGSNPAKSRISVLEDRDDDGLFETATVFADRLEFATGVQPWRGGVFVTMAGQVAYMKDTSGDGRADLIETWYSGFAENNTQLRANDPRLALDNHIYVANGLRGGKIVNVRRKGERLAPLDISGMDFRFDPLTGECEAVSGVGQFGMTFDDYGNRFVCTNRNPAIHIVLENHHLKKNPLVAVPAVTQDVATPGDESRIYPIGASWTTSNLHAGQFTAACGVEVYRGDALPKEYYGNIFACEPTAHLVHREIMRPKGVTFESTPADAGKEFLASRDPWFSPVNLEVGPDGALYVVDMYRAVIEHPHWMPTELQKRPDMLHGNDRGRIYRIVSKSTARPRSAPRLSRMSSSELVEQLEDRNSWRRETAARLLLERGDKAAQTSLLLTAQGGNSLARIHANRLLQALSLADAEHIVSAFDDADPRVIEQLLTMAEPWAGRSGPLRDRIISLLQHGDARVRVAAALALAPYPAAPAYSADHWEQQALLIAAGDRGGDFLALLLADTTRLEEKVENAKEFIRGAARLAAASSDRRQRDQGLELLLSSALFRQVGLTSFLSERIGKGASLDAIASALNGADRDKLRQAFVDARTVAVDAAQPDSARGEALDLLGLAGDSADVVTALALDDTSQAVRLRAIESLGRMPALEPWRELLARFTSETPVVQRTLLDGLLARPERTALLLDEIAAGRIKPAALDATRTAALLNHRDATIKQRAEQLFAAAIPQNRQQVLAEYETVLQMTGDAVHGREVFARHCATCHKIGDVGVNLAPDISDSREKTPLQLLTDILQPNRAVDSNYFGYTALTIDGLAITGILTAETSTSVTLKESAEKEVTLRRDEIDELASNGVSLMPEGLEREIPHPDMADLIAFIKNWRYLGGRSPASGE